MTIEELKDSILQLIEQIYQKKYIGKLWITRLDPIGLQVKLGMNNVDKPIVISAQLEDQDFLNFFKEELRSRGLNTIKYFLGVKSYPDQNNNNFCRCNGKID